MTPPPPAPMTADEHEPPVLGWLARLLSRALAASLAAWATIRRAAMGVAAVLIMLALAGLAGYALGRHSVAPKPGEEARLDTFDKRIQAVIDSARRTAEWERAQRVIAEQRAAALPRVEIRGPGVVAIGPTAGQLAPRVVPVPVEVTAALDAERRITAALRGELRADSVLIAAERARGDSLARAVVLARATRPGFLNDRVVLTVGYGITSAGGVVRPGWQVGVGVALWRWP
ncbi:MAG TPA: hypothetical protein VFK04_13065 [Gemmatimonadaceae bacterium]|nr:hypothetical protein [Gemmatimonadaceae bacterium]